MWKINKAAILHCLCFNLQEIKLSTGHVKVHLTHFYNNENNNRTGYGNSSQPERMNLECRIIFMGLDLIVHMEKNVSEYDQEMPQPHTADQPTSP